MRIDEQNAKKLIWQKKVEEWTLAGNGKQKKKIIET